MQIFGENSSHILQKPHQRRTDEFMTEE